MTAVVFSQEVLAETIEILRRGGRRGEERVVVWLAAAGGRETALVIEVYEPDQIAEFDNFRLPAESMCALMRHLGEKRRRIVAQIHTHPGRAYHSGLDAEWAIIRHVGALSLVLPRFARTTTVSSFLSTVMIYEFSAEAEWTLCPRTGPNARLRMIP